MKKLFPILLLAMIALWLWQKGPAPLPGLADSQVSQPAVSAGGAPAERSDSPRSIPPESMADDDSAIADAKTFDRYPDYLPPEALDTLALIESNGPFPYRKDGTVFQNRERRLPDKPRGYYREYTVETPGSDDRGARRIVAGGNPPQTFCYTDDHYRSFRCFDAAD